MANEKLSLHLFKAVEDGNYKKINYILALKGDINVFNYRGETPLLYAKDDEMFDYLISKGADAKVKNKDGIELLPVALGITGKRKYWLAKKLIEHGANIEGKDVFGSTPLINAIECDDEKMFDFLISKGADVNGENIFEQSALLLAVKYRRFELAEKLVLKGADVNKVSRNNETTPLFECVVEDDVELLEFFLNEGKGNPNTKRYNGNTALMYACRNSNFPMVRRLVKSGAKLDEKNDDGVTALMFACCGGDYDIVEYLIDNGADYTIKNIRGNDVFGYANYSLAEFIREVIKRKEIREKVNDFKNKIGKIFGR